MSKLKQPSRTARSLEGLGRFVSGGAFPVFTIALLGCWEIFLIALLLIPASASSLGAFADDFRVWCFGYDPATGRMQWAYVSAMLAPQLMMAGFIALFWWEPLNEVLHQPRRAAAYACSASALVVAVALGFTFSSSKPATGELPFPAEDIRTAFHSPELSLTNQDGAPVDLADLRGRVVLLTAVYASCGHTCPRILTETKAAIAQLDSREQQDVTVIAVTLDPSNDSPEILARLAEGHGLHAPLYNLVTGPSSRVEQVLDDMQIARSRNAETGVIDHANVFLLIDRDGRIAYRLALGERQKSWLTAAIRALLDESKTAAG